MPPVDPTAGPGPARRALSAFAKSRFGIWLIKHVIARIEPHLIKASNGRVTFGIGVPTVNVTTRGRKSGKPRTATLVYFTEGDNVMLIASSFGRDAHPAWYLNLKADPHAELVSRGRRGDYVAGEAEGAERDRLFALANRLFDGYDQYQAGTERKIPVMVLSPAAGE